MQPEQDDHDDLSPAMHQLLAEEELEARILAAQDAAFEEGLILTRAEAIELLRFLPPEEPLVNQ